MHTNRKKHFVDLQELIMDLQNKPGARPDFLKTTFDDTLKLRIMQMKDNQNGASSWLLTARASNKNHAASMPLLTPLPSRDKKRTSYDQLEKQNQKKFKPIDKPFDQ